MKLATLALPFALVPMTALATGGALTTDLPHALIAPVGSIAPELRSQLTWTAWPAGRPQLRQPVAAFPSSSTEWLAGTVMAPPGERIDWVLLGTAGPRAVSLLSRSAEVPGPPLEILAPQPAARAEAGRVVLTWTPAGAPALKGWRLERSSNGASWLPVTTVEPSADAAIDPVASGTWSYRMVPVLLDDVVVDAPGGASGTVRATDGDRDDDGLGDDADACDVAPGADCSWAWADVVPVGAPDGVVTIGDAVRLLRFAVGLETPTAAERLAADVAPALLAGTLAHPHSAAPHDVDIEDAVLALRSAVGLVRLPAPR